MNWDNNLLNGNNLSSPGILPRSTDRPSPSLYYKTAWHQETDLMPWRDETQNSRMNSNLQSYPDFAYAMEPHSSPAFVPEGQRAAGQEWFRGADADSYPMNHQSRGVPEHQT